jgi:hypothetical protein
MALEDKNTTFKRIHKKQMEIRSSVLNYALIMEGFTSLFLKELFGVTKTTEDTFCFGNKGSALPFNTKINLLIDVGVMDKTTIKKFSAFMAIRNQFMHNQEASSYEECFKFLKGTEKFLVDTYKIKVTSNKEECLKEAVEVLSGDCIKITSSIIAHIKMKRENYRKFDYAFYRETVQTIKKLENKFFEFIDPLVEKKASITAKEIKNMYINSVGSVFADIIRGVQEQQAKGIVTNP